MKKMLTLVATLLCCVSLTARDCGTCNTGCAKRDCARPCAEDRCKFHKDCVIEEREVEIQCPKVVYETRTAIQKRPVTTITCECPPAKTIEGEWSTPTCPNNCRKSSCVQCRAHRKYAPAEYTVVSDKEVVAADDVVVEDVTTKSSKKRAKADGDVVETKKSKRMKTSSK